MIPFPLEKLAHLGTNRTACQILRIVVNPTIPRRNGEASTVQTTIRYPHVDTFTKFEYEKI